MFKKGVARMESALQSFLAIEKTLTQAIAEIDQEAKEAREEVLVLTAKCNSLAGNKARAERALGKIQSFLE